MDVKYIDSIIESIDNIDACSTLQEVSTDIFKFMSEQLAGLTSQLQVFGELQKLLEIPKSIDDVLSWITDFINEYLAKVLAPYLKIQADVMLLTAKLVELEMKIEQKLQSLPSCKINLKPTI